MHAKPIASIDEWIAAHVFGREWLVIVGFIAEIELGHTSFGDNAAVVRLWSVLDGVVGSCCCCGGLFSHS